MPVGAMAFTPDGTALWIASHGSVEVLSWPDLDLIASVPAATAIRGAHSIAFHPAGRLAALGVGKTITLRSEDAQPLRRPPVQVDDGLLGIAFDENGRLLIAGGRAVFAAGPDGKPAVLGVPPSTPMPSWIWRAAILPASHRALYCVNDGRALLYNWDDGRVLGDDEFGRGFFEDDHSSWLAGDVAPGERALVCGRKSGRTWVVELRDGLPQRTVMVGKADVRRPGGWKRPTRTTAHAVHPTEDALVFAEISGYAGHARLSTGELVRELPRHSGGYAWE